MQVQTKEESKMSIRPSTQKIQGTSQPKKTSSSSARRGVKEPNTRSETGGSRGKDSVALSKEANQPEGKEAEGRVGSLIAALEAPEPKADSAGQEETGEPTFDEAVADSAQAIQETAQSRLVDVNPEAQVAILDSFGTEGNPGHGDAVEYVFQEATPETQPEVQRFQISPTGRPREHFFTAPGDASPEERLESFVEHFTVDGLMQTNAALESILTAPDSTIRTINQSQGINPASVARVLQGQLYERGEDGSVTLTDAGRTILDALGMEDTGPSQQQNIQFAELATQRIEEIFQNNQAVGHELDRHNGLSEELSERGVSYVVSAGNEATYGSVMGAELEGGFDDNLYSNPHNITVGAVDQTTGEVADFSSDDPEVDFLAPWVDIKVGEEEGFVASGTSFAAPLIADQLDALRAENPDISQQELRQLLEESLSGQFAE